MPAAPFIEIIYNFEENIEKAALAALASVTSGGVPAFRAREDDDTPAFSARVEFTLGGATGAGSPKPKAAPGNPQRVEYSEYTGTLEIQIESNRPTITAGSIAGIDTEFGVVRAKVRALFQESEWPLNDTNLPYYRVSLLRPAGSANGVTGEEERDIATLRYDVKFCIRPDAWLPTT